MTLSRDELLELIRPALEANPWPWPESELRALAQCRRESAGDPLAQSPTGARGLWQVTERTAREVLELLEIPRTEWAPYNPAQSTLLGVAYMARKCAPRFADRAQDAKDHWRLSVAAYNAGPTVVSRAMRELRVEELVGRPVEELPAGELRLRRAESWELWKAAGRPPAPWRTWAAVGPRVRYLLEADGERSDANEPLEYVAAIRRIFGRVGKGLPWAG